MTFSFDSALSTDRDMVRFFVGDTVSAGHRVENETITALLVIQPNPVFCAAMVARSIAAGYASKVDKAIGQTKISLSQAFDHWNALANRLQTGSVDGTGDPTLSAPVIGGISVDARTDLETGDPDRIQPEFRLGRDDHPSTPPGQQTRGGT